MSTTTNKKQGLAPLMCPEPRILILGSLPSDESIRQQEYYGNPKNLFWKVLAGVYGSPVPETYPEKKTFLAKHHIALWDVYASAEREGSLDSNIKEPERNDVLGLIRAHPTIQNVVLNGGKAASAFKRLRKLDKQAYYAVNVFEFTSTSPMSASAGWNLERIILVSPLTFVLVFMALRKCCGFLEPTMISTIRKWRKSISAGMVRSPFVYGRGGPHGKMESS